MADAIKEARRWLVKVSATPPTSYRVNAEPRAESIRAAAICGHARIFKGKLYAQFLAECVRQLSPQAPSEPLTGDLIAVVEVVVTKPKTTIKVRPGGDVDNLYKGVGDALTQAKIWVDDDNLTSVVIHKRWGAAGEEPGANIMIGTLPAA